MYVLWGKLWGSTCTCVCFIQIGARQACIIFQWMTVRVRAQKGLNGFTFVPYHLLSTDACLIKREQHAREQKAQRMVMCWTKEAAAKSSTDIVLRVQDRCWNGMQSGTTREVLAVRAVLAGGAARHTVQKLVKSMMSVCCSLTVKWGFCLSLQLLT